MTPIQSEALDLLAKIFIRFVKVLKWGFILAFGFGCLISTIALITGVASQG